MDTLYIQDTSPTKQFAYILDSSPTAHFAYRHHKNTYPAFHTAALSVVITQFLLYIAWLYECMNYVKSSRWTV